MVRRLASALSNGLNFRPPSLCKGCLLSDDNICNSLPRIASSSFIFHIFPTFTYLSEQLDASSLSQHVPSRFGRTAKLRDQVGTSTSRSAKHLTLLPFLYALCKILPYLQLNGKNGFDQWTLNCPLEKGWLWGPQNNTWPWGGGRSPFLIY